MTTANTSSILQDVVAYVDVWSSDRNANYSQPIIQQLQDMGAQVTKTFNKQVTHVVFGNGHSATWRKAKNSNVRLVSVLWVGRCFDDGVRADEELYPALEERNPVLKNKKHRCMQPKDSPEKTPNSDKRMKKKLDKLMKGFVSKQPSSSDVSPIYIDEESGIIYSPGLKRSDYMAQRLKDMKEKRDRLSPTASQMLESGSPTEPRPSLGSTPTVLRLTYDESGPDPSTSAAAPTSAYSPHKEEGTTYRDFSDHSPLERGRGAGSEKPWLSPRCDVPKGISSPLKCPDFSDDEDKDGNTAKKSRTSVRKKAGEKPGSAFLFESPSRTDNRSFQKGKRRSQIKPCSSSADTSEKGKQKITDTGLYTDAVNSPSHCLKPISEAVAKVPRITFTSPSLKKMEQKTPKRARLSLSSLVKSCSISGSSKRVCPGSAAGDDDIFEDYFSTPDHQRRSSRQMLPELLEEVPFQLEFSPKKRKQKAMPEPSSKKKKEQSGESHNQQCEPVADPQPDLKESLLARRRRQSTLPFTSTSTTRAAARRRRASVHSLTSPVDNDDAPSESSENVGRGDKRPAGASLTELPSEEGEEDCVEPVWNPLKMVTATKAMRTLVMTSMPTEKQQVVNQVVEALGGFTVVDEVCESTTHVVSGGHRRTLNILLGIARGCWILSFEWILWCLEQRQWIPEEPYELSDQFPAAQICRLQRHLSAGEHQQDLFQSLPAIFVSQHSQPPTQSLVELIQLCGGTVCKTVRQAGICIGRYSGRRPEGSRILSEQWVLDSIMQLRQLSYDGYDLD